MGFASIHRFGEGGGGFQGLGPWVGVIVECPLNGLFLDLVNIILKSRMAVTEMIDNNSNNDWPLVKSKDQHVVSIEFSPLRY